MKALILSDIHSNIIALEAIERQERDCDIICCTGDLVDYGPSPREVLDWVRAHNVYCTQGNHDRWVVDTYNTGKDYNQIPRHERAWVDHNANLLDYEDIVFIETLPQTLTFSWDEISYGMSHMYKGYDEINNLHAFHNFRNRTFDNSDFPDFPRLILGHTHRQGVHYLSNEILWLNPGSVSYRRSDDPDQTAHYASITDGMISLKRILYDISPLRRQVQGISLKDSETRAAERFFGERDL